MDLLVTGGSGFLGSQLVTQWLHRHPQARVACLVRATDLDAADAKLRAALSGAMADQAMQADPGPLLARATVLRGDVTDPGWVAGAAGWLDGPAEVLHCAANLSFRAGDRDQVWRTNVGGTAALLDALPALPALRGFNYVSTAYVAGDRQGAVLEDVADRPAAFNNAYEESKWTAEGLVREACGRAGIAWRVFRPSIIVAHSVTRRMAAGSGFYKVVETLVQFGQSGAAGESPILLPVPEAARLDLIPVDLVVGEIIALIGLGGRSRDRTFHVTSETPLPLARALSELSPMTGVAIGTLDPASAAPSALAALIMRRLRHYMPYLGYVRSFDRRNVRALDASRAQGGFRFDVPGLRDFVAAFMESARGAC